METSSAWTGCASILNKLTSPIAWRYCAIGLKGVPLVVEASRSWQILLVKWWWNFNWLLSS